MLFPRHFPVTLGALLFASLAPALQAADAPPAPEVLVETVKVEALPLEFEYSARTAGYREVQVRAQVSGILQERTYLEGSQVKQGQVMFRIDPRTYQAALSRAKGALAQEQARYRQTERDLKRIRELQKKGFASESELDNAISNFEQSKANIQAAEAEVQSKQIDLDYTTVKAPISGITSKETVSEGSLMVAGDPNASLLSNITQLDPIYVNFAAPDSDVESVRSGLQNGSLVLPEDGQMSVLITLGDGSVYPLEGKVDFTDSTIDRSTGQSAGYAPRHHLYGRVDWLADHGWAVGLQANRVAGRERAAGDARAPVPDYTTVDLSLRSPANTRSGQWTLTVHNLFDADVREPSWYSPNSLVPVLIADDLPMAGRSIMLQWQYAL